MIIAFSDSPEQTKEVAATLAAIMQDHDLVLLSGELGAGKTTFTQGFSRGLGVEEQVTSPTFVLVRTYTGRLALHHADVYRLDSLDEVLDLGLLEMLDEGGVAFIEWGEIATPVMPRDYLQVRLAIADDNDEHRHIELSCVGPRWNAREHALATALQPWTGEVIR